MSPPSAIPHEGAVEITGLSAMELSHTVGSSLVRVETGTDLVGYGEAGADGPTVRAQLRQLEDDLLGEDPLEIHRHFDAMVTRQHPYRPHAATVSGVDIALWDLAGKILDRPISKLMTGQFRQEVPFYLNGGPDDLLDRESCEQWAGEVTEKSSGPHPVKIDIDRVIDRELHTDFGAIGQRFPTLKRSDVQPIRNAARNLREVMGERLDFIAHCHNEWDIPSATAICEALAPGEPLWIEDPLSVNYGKDWLTLRKNSPIPVLTGEKLEFSEEFFPFLVNGAVDAVQPDLAYAGGITGCRNIAHLADLNSIPVTTHNVGSLVLNAASVQFGASVRNFWITETRITQVDLFDEMGESSGLDPENGSLTVPDGPGLGIDLNEEVVLDNRVEGEPCWE